MFESPSRWDRKGIPKPPAQSKTTGLKCLRTEAEHIEMPRSMWIVPACWRDVVDVRDPSFRVRPQLQGDPAVALACCFLLPAWLAHCEMVTMIDSHLNDFFRNCLAHGHVFSKSTLWPGCLRSPVFCSSDNTADPRNTGNVSYRAFRPYSIHPVSLFWNIVGPS